MNSVEDWTMNKCVLAIAVIVMAVVGRSIVTQFPSALPTTPITTTIIANTHLFMSILHNSCSSMLKCSCSYDYSSSIHCSATIQRSKKLVIRSLLISEAGTVLR